MGKSSQTKGRRAELELCRVLQGYGYQVEPGAPINYGTEPDLIGLPSIHIECKRAETLLLSKWMAQATRDAQRFGDGVPAVFHRKNHEDWTVTMPLTAWMTIYKQAFPGDFGTTERK